MKCSTLKESKETCQSNAIPNHGLGPVFKGKNCIYEGHY